MEKLSEYAGKILNDETCIAVRDEWFARMRNLFDGTELLVMPMPIFYMKNRKYGLTGRWRIWPVK